MNKRQAQFVVQMLKTSDVINNSGYIVTYRKNAGNLYRDSYHVNIDHYENNDHLSLRTAEDVFKYVSVIENQIRMKDALE